jgi:hypothetical protein
MRIKTKDWVIFISIAILCLGFWYKFEYPHFSFVDLSVNKKDALFIANVYLKLKGIDTEKYLKSIVFDTDEWFNRYLQKTLGIKAEEDFIRQHGFDLFCWKVRFFRELQKEEYVIWVSAGTGSVLRFRHLIEDIEAREDIGKEAAKQKAEKFLKNSYGLDLKAYDFHEEKVKRLDKRIDYSFSWEKKGIFIPWEKNQGGAKLLIGATVSGNEIREFYKNRLDIPEKFQRYIENQFILAEYLYSFYFILFIILLMVAMTILMRRRHDLIPRLTKKWFCYLAIFVAIVNIIDILNNTQDIMINCPTSVPLASFIGLYWAKIIVFITFLAVCSVIPGLAGESLCNEVFPQSKYSSFLHYIKSNIFNRSVSKAIVFGYILSIIMLGLQAVIFYFGQKHLGVWREWFKLMQFSSAYIPLLSAFVIGATASLNEEITFRLFGISWSKKYLRNTVLAFALPSIIWGLGHTAYVIFPVWFRIIEISIIGFLFGFIFLRYGLISLIVAHYLFDVFWGANAYILGHSSTYLFFGSILTLCIPLIFAVIAYCLNRGEKEREIKNILDKIQEYNLNILITFITLKKSQGVSPDAIKRELTQHNWDPSLVDFAIADVFKI